MNAQLKKSRKENTPAPSVSYGEASPLHPLTAFALPDADVSDAGAMAAQLTELQL